MKFGKVLQQSMQVSSSAWEAHWVDYKLLKNIIKDCAQIQKEEKLEGTKLVKIKIKPDAKEDIDSIRTSPDEMNFFRTLRSEIKKISDFFIKEQGAYIGRIQAVEAQVVALKSNPMPAAKTDLMKTCVSLYKELLLLENFAVMNFCGISKIVKKHDKWTGYATRNKFMRTILMKQPFATYLPLLQMIDRLEHMFMEATGGSIDQHDHSRRRGPADSATSGPTPDTGTSAMSGASPSPPPHTPPQHALHQTLPSSSTGSATTTPTNVGRPNRSPSRPLMDGSPVRDDAVTLGRVHALRDDARHFRETEAVDSNYDGDDDGDSTDEAAMQAVMSPKSDSDETSGTATASAPTHRHSIELPPMRTMTGASTTGLRKGYNSDSDAAAIAMLSMKEGGVPPATGAPSGMGGFRSGSDSEGGSRYKRKACSPLNAAVAGNGKRKMSFATILN